MSPSLTRESSVSFTQCGEDGRPVQFSPPTLSVQPSSGDEDTAISLSITFTPSQPNTTYVITIFGLPAKASLSAGIRNLDGSWSLTPAQLQDLTLLPPPDFEGGLRLLVKAAPVGPGFPTMATFAVLDVTVTPVADPPILTVHDVLNRPGFAGGSNS